MYKVVSKNKKSLPASSSSWTFFKAAFGSFRFIDISGRSSRKEWWTVNMAALLLMIMAAIIYSFTATFVFGFDYDTASLEDLNTFLDVGQFINLFFSIPVMAVGVRRFHDLGWSAWLSVLVIPTFLLPFLKGENNDNRYGVNIYKN